MSSLWAPDRAIAGDRTIAGDKATASLESARDALRQAMTPKDLKIAEDFYGPIDHRDPLFATKLQDLVQWRLRLGHGSEAWKLLVIAERLGLPWQDQDYAKVLAAFQRGICTLGMPVENPGFRFLEAAAIYRFGQRFSKNPQLPSPYDVAARGRRLSYLRWNQPPYLMALAQTNGYRDHQLITGRGCMSDEDDLRDPEERQHQEFIQLKNWWAHRNQAGHKVLKGETPVILRLLWLSLTGVSNDEHRVMSVKAPAPKAAEAAPSASGSTIRDADLASTLLDFFKSRFHHLSTDLNTPWADLNSEEKRYLWGQFIVAKQVSSPPYHGKSQEAASIVEFMKGSLTGRDAANWYGLLDLPSIPLQQHQEILDLILQKKSDLDDSLGCFLLNRAQIAFIRGQTTLTLTTLRRILVDEVGDDRDVETAAEQLATELITEYQYDPAILGTIQSLLPPNIWAQIFQKIAIDHGIRGQKSAFEKVIAAGQKNSSRSFLNIGPLGIETLRAMAGRNIQNSHLTWKRFGLTQPRQAITLIERIAERTLGLKNHEKPAVSPYLRVILQTLEETIKGGRSRELLSDLRLSWRFALESSRYQEGVATVQGGVVQAGVVDLKNSVSFMTCGPIWSPPQALEPKELLPIPQTIGAQEWEIR